MVRLRMRLLPDGYSYSRTFHTLFSTLCKEVRRTPTFYSDLDRIRQKIKTFGIDAVMDALSDKDVLSPTAAEYFDQMKAEIPRVGRELQSKALAYLMSLRDTGDSVAS